MNRQNQLLLISGVILLVFGLIIMLSGITIKQVEVCEDRIIPIKFVGVENEGHDLYFTYEWTGENNDLSLIGFLIESSSEDIDPMADEFDPIRLEMFDLFIINITLEPDKFALNYNMENTLFFNQTDTGCIQPKTQGWYFA